MAIEIERKFLVLNDDWRASADGGLEIRQGYLTDGLNPSVRVRTKGAKGFLTIKGDEDPLSRFESEFEIPHGDARDLLDRFCGGRILSKTRHRIDAGSSLVWEVDCFHGSLDGLVLAEIELPYAEMTFSRPSWIGNEVTHDHRYLNSNLCKLSLRDITNLVNNDIR